MTTWYFRRWCVAVEVFLALLVVLDYVDALERSAVDRAQADVRSAEAGESWLGPCTIHRLQIPASGVLPRRKSPYVATLPSGRNSDLARRLERATLLREMGNATCTPSKAGSIRKDIEEMPLREYIEDWMSREVSRSADENKYVFGEFGDQWAPLREAYVRPPCPSCSGDKAAVTIGLGGLYSGAPWHFHDAAFVEMLHGAKHFALLPPQDPAIQEVRKQVQEPGLSQLHWHREHRPDLEKRGLLQGMQECVIYPGEILYSPDGWHHGIVNLSPYTAFVSSFLQRETTTAMGGAASSSEL